MTDHPYVYCRLETRDKIYEVTDYQIHQERQRPTLAKMTLKEPIEKGINVILQVGYLNTVYRITFLKTLSCSQIAKETFDVVALEPVRQILDVEFTEQIRGVNLESSLKSIAATVGFSLKTQGAPLLTKPQNMMFIGSIRNALDQVWQVFELDQARWAMMLLKQEFHLLTAGKFIASPVEIPMDYFKQEFEGGVETNIVPMFRPYTPVIWNGTEEIIDIARTDSKTRSMFITFADKAL